MDNNTIFRAINAETGEYKDFSAETYYLRSRKQDIAFHKKMNAWNNPYAWGNMLNIKLLLSEHSISDLTLGAIVALTAYINDREKGTLIAGEDKHPLSRKEIQQVLNLKDRTFKSMLKELLQTGVIFEQEKQFRFNEKYHHVGALKDRSTLQYMVRIQKNGVRTLLQQGLDLKDIGLIYKVIPWVDTSSCIICHNPNATEGERTPFTLEELASVLGTDASHLTRKLSRLTFNHRGLDVNVFGFTGAVGYKDRVYMVNPVILRRNSYFNGVDFKREHKQLEEIFVLLAAARKRREQKQERTVKYNGEVHKEECTA